MSATERSELIAAVGDDLATADRIDPTASDGVRRRRVPAPDALTIRRDPFATGERSPSGPNRRSPRMHREIDRHRLGATLFLIAAAASFVLSITLWFTDNRQEGVFVGLWVPSILAAGAFWIVAMGRGR
jgi:hypothetical protein